MHARANFFVYIYRSTYIRIHISLSRYMHTYLFVEARGWVGGWVAEVRVRVCLCVFVHACTCMCACRCVRCLLLSTTRHTLQPKTSRKLESSCRSSSSQLRTDPRLKSARGSRFSQSRQKALNPVYRKALETPIETTSPNCGLILLVAKSLLRVVM